VRGLLPHIDVFVTYGHTMAQQLVRVTGANLQAELIYGGDVIATSSHLRGPFVMGYDLHPLVVMEEKEKILKELASSGGVLFFEHDPSMTGARVVFQNGDFAVKEAVNF
jgi:glyoxylase-like metal-dependent hydrolase (beta-lactamase superfamily II)